MTRKTKTYLFVVGGALLLLVGIPLWFIFGPPRRLVISPETTVLTHPLTADGQVDYLEGVLQQQRAGVTPENNAAVPLVQATWGSVVTNPEAQEFLCHELAIPKPEQEKLDEEFRSPRNEQRIIAWASEKWGVDLGDKTKYEFDARFYLDEVRYRPWRRADYPPLTTWVDENTEQLELLHEMEHRGAFYYPSPYYYKPDASLMSNSASGGQQMRRAARALNTRAMMHIGEGKAQLAWRDLRLIFLMTRIQMKHTGLIDAMIAYAIEGVAYDATQYLLDSGHCDRPLLDEMSQFFLDLPPPVDVATSMNTIDRWMMLEHGSKAKKLSDLTIDDSIPGFSGLLDLPYDKNAMLRRINQRFDQWVNVMKIDDPAKYLLAASQQSAQSDEEYQAWNNQGAIAAATISQSVRGIYAADVVCGWAIASHGNAKRPLFRARMEEQLLRVAIQLAKYRLAHGEYPEKLDMIAAELAPADLLDTYAVGEELVYERREDSGYLLYSLYENGIDDDGTSWYGEIFQGDWATPGDHADVGAEDVDLVIRFPLPAPPQLVKPKSIAEEEAEYAELLEGEDELMLEEVEEENPLE